MAIDCHLIIRVVFQNLNYFIQQFVRCFLDSCFTCFELNSSCSKCKTFFHLYAYFRTTLVSNCTRYCRTFIHVVSYTIIIRIRTTFVSYWTSSIRTLIYVICNTITICIRTTFVLSQTRLIRTCVIDISYAIVIAVRTTLHCRQASFLRATIFSISNTIQISIRTTCSCFRTGNVRTFIIFIQNAVTIFIRIRATPHFPNTFLVFTLVFAVRYQVAIAITWFLFVERNISTEVHVHTITITKERKHVVATEEETGNADTCTHFNILCQHAISNRQTKTEYACIKTWSQSNLTIICITITQTVSNIAHVLCGDT
eukprot:Opistho-1_new@48992